MDAFFRHISSAVYGQGERKRREGNAGRTASAKSATYPHTKSIAKGSFRIWDVSKFSFSWRRPPFPVAVLASRLLLALLNLILCLFAQGFGNKNQAYGALFWFLLFISCMVRQQCTWSHNLVDGFGNWLVFPS